MQFEERIEPTKLAIEGSSYCGIVSIYVCEGSRATLTTTRHMIAKAITNTQLNRHRIREHLVKTQYLSQKSVMSGHTRISQDD